MYIYVVGAHGRLATHLKFRWVGACIAMGGGFGEGYSTIMRQYHIYIYTQQTLLEKQMKFGEQYIFPRTGDFEEGLHMLHSQ